MGYWRRIQYPLESLRVRARARAFLMDAFSLRFDDRVCFYSIELRR